MRRSLRATIGGVVTAVFLATALGAAPAPSPAPTARPIPALPTWKDEIAKGFVPHHQLTVDDFPAKDSGKKYNFYVKTFIDPRYQYYLYFNRGWVHAYIKQWRVFSGFDRNDSYRDSHFREMKASLPYAQALLDLNEIHARKLAAVPPDGFPECRTGSEHDAVTGLDEKMKAMIERVYSESNREADAFIKATNFGEDKAKTRKLAAEISQRLQATPEPTPFGLPPETTASPSASPTPSPTPASTHP